MSWVDTVIWWHCYPLRFVAAEAEAIDHLEHRLPHLQTWLDHVVGLGANGILLAPIFASGTHGYDTVDHGRIDPRLGDEADFDGFVAAARERGVRVALDGVFNHLSRDHELVQRAMAGGPNSADGGWLRWQGEYPLVFEGHHQLVELNLSDTRVQDYVVAVMNHWLDRGADGWRLDAAYAQGAEVWRPIVDRVRAEHPDCWITAEVIHGDYVDFVNRSGVDAVTQYELWKGIWSSINDVNFHELAWSLKRHTEFLQSFRPQNFIGNHDVTRIASQITDPANVSLAAALLLLLPGIPTIYAGDEFGWTGTKTDGVTGDDAVRPTFPRPVDLAGSDQDAADDYRRLVHLRRTHAWLVDAQLEVVAVSNATIAIRLSGPEQRRSLVLNAGDRPETVTIDGQPVSVDAHAWWFEG